ncbi:MAG: TPM domain-containing protein [Mucinivorans sp.]
MIIKTKTRLLLLTVAASVFVLLSSVVCSTAQQVPAAPRPARLVNDLAGIFTPAQVQLLEDSLVAFDRATSTQIAIVTLPDLGSYAPSQMAFSIMDQWGVGQKDKNNGVVMLLKPRNEVGKGEIFIATGLGLEGVLPDGRVTRMIDQQMIPFLKRGEYFAAAQAGAQALRDMTRGEYTADQEPEWKAWAMLIGFGLFIVFVIVLVAMANKHKGGKGNNGNGEGDSSPWLWFLLGALSNSGGRSGRGGGGFGDSSGGGGFGGFGGGGSFGGGGGRSF